MEFRSQIFLLLWVMLSWICTDVLKAAQPFGARIKPLLRLQDQNCTTCHKPVLDPFSEPRQSNYADNATLRLKPNHVDSSLNQTIPEWSSGPRTNKNVNIKSQWNTTQSQNSHVIFQHGKSNSPISEWSARNRKNVQKSHQRSYWHSSFRNLGVPNEQNISHTAKHTNQLGPITKKEHSTNEFESNLPKHNDFEKLKWLWNITHSVNSRIPDYSIKNPLEKTEQTASPLYAGFNDERYKKGATFFFTHVEPHRFEYRAMFQHKRQNSFEPFVHHFNHFPPLPKFPSFPEFPEIFPHNEPHFPKLSDFPDFTFPTLPPVVLKRTWQPLPESQTQRPILDENLDGPLKKYDVVLGNVNYPKIFRFNEERINIEDFDKQKKLRVKLARAHQNELLEPENVKRDQLLILHGGIFTVKEPPLYSRFHARKIRKSNGLRKTFP